jgi:hypothetical protein
VFLAFYGKKDRLKEELLSKREISLDYFGNPTYSDFKETLQLDTVLWEES